eukprot:gene13157-biopygen10375
MAEPFAIPSVPTKYVGTDYGSLLVRGGGKPRAQIQIPSQPGCMCREVKSPWQRTFASFSRDGDHILSATSEDCTRVAVWATRSWRIVAALAGHTGSVNDADFDPSGGRVASASNDMWVKLWDVSSGRVIRDLSAHTRPVKVAKFDAAGARLMSVGDDAKVKLWDTRCSGGCTCSIHVEGMTTASLSAAGDRVLCSGNHCLGAPHVYPSASSAG